MLIEEILGEKCWKGYQKKGMKTMFGKRVPNCVGKKGRRTAANRKRKQDPDKNRSGKAKNVKTK